MIARRMATVVAALLAVAGFGAGGGAATAQPRLKEAAAVAPVPAKGARPAGRETDSVARAETVVRNAPAAFRLPPGSRVTALADRESGASFTLTAPGPEAVLSFYRRELPRGAFTIVADRAEAGATSLAFRSADGWAGSIYATTYRATVALTRA